jgi:DNA replication protein DnaC
MNTNASLAIFKEMKLEGMHQAYQEVLEMPIQNRPETDELLAHLLDREQQYRANKKAAMCLKMSGLRYRSSLEEITLNQERNLTKNQLLILSSTNFIDKAQNVIMTGATGCGKSFLACAVGQNICNLGLKVSYFNINRLIEQINLAHLNGTYVRFLNRLQKIPLLIFDDFGLKPLDKQTKLAFLQILEDRYAKHSTIFVSQLPVSSWHQFLDDPTIADAILDRITANAHRIELKGKSLRIKI